MRSRITNLNIDALLEILLGEHFVDAVAELSPADVSALLGSLEVVGQEAELSAGQHNLAHVETNSELSLSDIAASQFVEVAEEFRDSNSLLLADLSQLGNDVLDVVRLVLLDVVARDSGSGLRVVVERMVEATANLEQVIRRVNVLAEVVVVDLIDVTLVHVGLGEHVEDVLARGNAEQAKSAQELVLGNVLVLRDVEVHEHGLQVDSLDPNGLSVLVKNALQHLLLLIVEVKVLASGKHSGIIGNGRNLGLRILLNAVSSESLVDARAEVLVVDHELGVIRLVLAGEGHELLGGQVEVEHGQDLLKLVLGDLTSAKLVEIEEEFFDTHSLHNDGRSQSIFNVIRVV